MTKKESKNQQPKAEIVEPIEPRPETALTLSFRATDPIPYNFFPGISRDPATGGLFVALDRPFPIGTRLNLSFLTESRRVESIAEVCWSHKIYNGSTPETKVRLVDIDPEDRDLIEFYIREKK